MLGRMFLGLSWTAVFLVTNPAIADDSHLSIQGLSQQETVEFIRGVGTALGYYDILLRMEGKDRLICPPDGNIGPRMVWAAASGALKGPHDRDTVVIAALDELRRAFPCR